MPGRLIGGMSLFCLVWLASACQSPPTASAPLAARQAKEERPQDVRRVVPRPVMQLSSGGSLAQPEVWASTPKEADLYCNHVRDSQGVAKGARADDLIRECKRAQQASLNERRTACLRSTASVTPNERAKAIEQCTSGGQVFEQALQDRKDFDQLSKLATLEELAGLEKRLALAGDRLGLRPEVRSRMNGLCEQASPGFSSVAEWTAAVSLYQVAGEGGRCAEHAATAKTALLDMEKQEQRMVLSKATTWRSLLNFVGTYELRDPGNLLPTARERLAEVRGKEIAAMRAMPLEALEPFWRNGDDATQEQELKDLTRARLVEESIAEKTFSGALRAYRVTQDVTYVANSQRLARTPAERKALEEVAVKKTASPGRFFRVAFTATHGQPRRDEITHAGLFALYTMTGSIPVEGLVTVQRAPNAPGPLAHGQYRVLIEAEMKLRKGYSRASRMLGNQDSFREETIKKQVSVLLSPPSMSGSASVNFGDITAVLVKRGSSGGIEQEWVDADPVIRVSVVGVEVL